MKLFKWQNRNPIDHYPTNTIISCGKLLEQSIKQNLVADELQMSALERVYVTTGFYIKIELPFSRLIQYLDATNFIYKIGKSRKVYLYRYRYSEIMNKVFSGWSSIWVPINSDNDLIDTPRNEQVYGTFYINEHNKLYGADSTGLTEIQSDTL